MDPLTGWLAGWVAGCTLPPAQSCLFYLFTLFLWEHAQFVHLLFPLRCLYISSLLVQTCRLLTAKCVFLVIVKRPWVSWKALYKIKLLLLLLLLLYSLCLRLSYSLAGKSSHLCWHVFKHYWILHALLYEVQSTVASGQCLFFTTEDGHWLKSKPKNTLRALRLHMCQICWSQVKWIVPPE